MCSMYVCMYACMYVCMSPTLSPCLRVCLCRIACLFDCRWGPSYIVEGHGNEFIAHGDIDFAVPECPKQPPKQRGISELIIPMYQ